MEDLTGRQFGAYRIVAPLGEGGMAVVYKAYQPNVDRTVALKILPAYFARDPQFVGRFQQEAKLLANLQHVNILPVHDFGESDGYTYIVMPFIETGTLGELLSERPLPLPTIQRIMTQVGSALDYAHSRRIVHRDIKPTNILITEQGDCLLSDFGIAKIVEGTSTFTQMGGTLGTPTYMSPEQIRGEKLDGRSDIYSLGVVLYEMATGRPPFRAETPPALFVKHLHDPLPPPHLYNPDVPAGVERVILKALAKSREDRYETAGALAAALAEVIATQSTVKGVPVPESEAVSSPKRTAVPVTEPAVPTPPQRPAVPETEPALPTPPPPTPVPGSEPATPRPARRAEATAQVSAPGAKRRLPVWAIGLIALVAVAALGVGLAMVLSGNDEPVPTATLETAMAGVVEIDPSPTSRPTDTPTPVQPAAEEPPDEQVMISIWHQWGGDYLANVQAAFDRYMVEHPNVVIDLFQPEDTSRALSVAIPAGEGPDIIGWANDQIGAQALAGNIVALDDYGIDMAYLNATFEPAAIRGVVWQEMIWGLPESQEGIAFVYNKAMVSDEYLPTDPLDFDTLLEKAKAFYEETGKYLVCNQGLGNSDAYHVAPIYFGHGMPAYVDDEGNVYLNTRAGVEAAEWMVGFSAYAPARTSHAICAGMIANGEAGAWWTGPWAIADLEAAGIDYGIVPMGRPFVGIKVLMLSKNAVDRGHEAVALDIIKTFTSGEVQAQLAVKNKTLPAVTGALQDPAVQALQTLEGFRAALNLGVPMANTPFASAQWGPVSEATMAVWSGSQTPAEAMAAAQQLIETAIREMGGPAAGETPIVEGEGGTLSCEDPLGCVLIGPGEPIRMGAMLALSGADQPVGLDALRGLEMAVQERGELLGHGIELVSWNADCTDEGGVEAATALTADPRIVAIVGPSCSNTARTAAPIACGAHVALVSPSASGPDLTAADRPAEFGCFLRTAPNDKAEGTVAAEYAREVLGVMRAATAGDGSTYAAMIAQAFVDRFRQLGGEITAQEVVAPDGSGAGPALARIAASGPELIFYPVFVEAGGQLTRLARSTPGLEEVELMGAGGMFSPEVLELAGEAAVGLTWSTLDLSAAGPGYEQLRPQYEKRYGELPLTPFHAYAYDAAHLIWRAIEKVAVRGENGALQIGRQALLEALYSARNQEGLTGRLSCRPNGDCADARVSMYRCTASDPASWNPGEGPENNPRRIWP